MLPLEQSRSFVLLWNRGSSPLMESDFTRPISVEGGPRVKAISIFDKDAVSAVRISKSADNTNSDEIVVHLLRPDEAIVLEILAETSNPLRMSVEMVSADMSVVFRRSQLFHGAVEFIFLLIAMLLGVLVLTNASLWVWPWWIGTLMLGLFLLWFWVDGSQKLVQRLEKRFVSPVVSRFLAIKEAALRARIAADRIQNAYATLRHENR